MTVEDIFAKLATLLPDSGIELLPNAPEAIILVPRDYIRDVSLLLRDSSEFGFESMTCLTGIERAGGLEVAYSLFSNKLKKHINLKVKVSYEDASIPTVADIWRTADWHEREAFDMFGFTFVGHPDHRRILCADDWEGYPLRKDYQPPLFFHDIPVTVNVPGGANSPATRAL